VRRDQFDWHCEWLQNTPREDGKPRVLLISEYNGNGDVDNSGFIGRIKEVCQYKVYGILIIFSCRISLVPTALSASSFDLKSVPIFGGTTTF
jgi:hypothetical protein